MASPDTLPRMRVLFVDDDPHVLTSIRRGLSQVLKRMAPSFANSAGQALDLLGREAYDVVVSDLEMPVEDGVSLLGRMRDAYPHVVRIILSGSSTREALRTLPVAHQFVAKPVAMTELADTLNRAVALRPLLTPGLLEVVGRVEELPSLPRVYLRLVEALEDPATSVEEVAVIVEEDPAMAARVLQIANSAYFGLAQRTSTLRRAVLRLGLDNVHTLVFVASAFRAFEHRSTPKGFSLAKLQKRAFHTSQIARAIAPRGLHMEAATAALLLDIGTLLYATATPPAWVAAAALAKRERIPIEQAEERTMGVSHAEVGAYLLSLWGLPAELVEAVAHHHHPERLGSTTYDLGTAVHVAESLADEVLGEPHHLDVEHLDRLGLADRLESWRATARHVDRP